jgi:hypothetical protein
MSDSENVLFILMLSWYFIPRGGILEVLELTGAIQATWKYSIKRFFGQLGVKYVSSPITDSFCDEEASPGSILRSRLQYP